jgi:hypothetical protein
MLNNKSNVRFSKEISEKEYLKIQHKQMWVKTTNKYNNKIILSILGSPL